MKRVLSLILVLALVLGMVPAGFAADKTAGEQLKELGLVKGDQNGALNESADITRAEMMVVLARLLGKFDDASKFATPSLSTDVKGHWAANYIAFAEKEGWTAGKGAGVFAPNDKVTVQEAATFMMKALGYTVTDFGKVVEEATKLGVMKGITATTGNAPRSLVFSAALNTLNTTPKDGKEALGVKLGVMKATTPTTPVAGPLAVDTVTVKTAKSFEVKFKSAVADTAKVGFALMRDTTKATFTATWNADKTVATLTAPAKLADGNYTVTVNDIAVADKPVVLNTTKVVIEKEKVTKVTFDSKQVTRLSDGKGYVGFAVFNQYNEDITDSALGRGLSWTVSTSTPTPDVNYKSKMVTIAHNDGQATNNLASLSTVVLTARDTSTGFVSSATLEVSKTVGVVNAIKIEGIVNEKGEEVAFVYGSGKTYYLKYSVTDVNGKDVKDFSLLTQTNNGLKVLSVTASNNTNITMSEDRDPKNSSNLAYRINLTTAPTFDTPISFIANAAYSGVNATFTTTLKKAAALQTFKLFSPAETVSVNKSVEIPFEAFDQNGEAITKYSDISGNVTFSDNTAELVKQADGTAKLFVTHTATGTKYLTATVPNSTTGSFSQVSFEVKNTSLPAKLASLAIGRAVTSGSSYDIGRISTIDIRDQYDNKMNLRTALTSTYGTYKLFIESSNTAAVTVTDGSAPITYVNGNAYAYITGGATEGSATITYKLVNDLDGDSVIDAGELIDTATTVVYNIGLDKIVDLKMDADAETLYNVTASSKYYTSQGAVTALGSQMVSSVDIYGVSKSGMEVELRNSDVKSFTSSNSLFTASYDSTNEDYVVIADKAYSTGVHSATTTLTAMVETVNGIFTKSIEMKSSDDAPVAKDITVRGYSAHFSDMRNGNISKTNNVYTLKAAYLNGLANNSLFAYNNADGTSNTKGTFYFQATSQYPNYFAASTTVLDKIVVVKNAGTGTLTVNPTTGVITTAAAVAGDVYTVTVLSGSKTLTIVIKVTN